MKHHMTEQMTRDDLIYSQLIITEQDAHYEEEQEPRSSTKFEHVLQVSLLQVIHTFLTTTGNPYIPLYYR